MNPNSYSERELRKNDPSQHARNEYARKKQQGMHPRLGWCKKGDWNGRLPKGMAGGVWNSPCDCVRPQRMTFLNENYPDSPSRTSEFLVGWYQNSQVDTMMFIVPCDCGEQATLCIKNNIMTGKTGWWN